MKQFLIPALLLALVGTVAAIAAGSPPVFKGGEECHGVCPMSAGHEMPKGHCPSMGAMESGECKEASGECKEAAEQCPGMQEECEKRCEEKNEPDCCKKKSECGKCPKPAEPAEKP